MLKARRRRRLYRGLRRRGERRSYKEGGRKAGAERQGTLKGQRENLVELLHLSILLGSPCAVAIAPYKDMTVLKIHQHRYSIRSQVRSLNKVVAIWTQSIFESELSEALLGGDSIAEGR